MAGIGRPGRKLKNLAGMIFGKLTVLEKMPDKVLGQTTWKCRCECGNEVVKRYGDLKSPRERKTPNNCGCIRKTQPHRKIYYGPHLPKQTPRQNLFSRMKSHAVNDREKHFDLKYADFEVISQQNCFYCGTPPEMIYYAQQKDRPSCLYNGLDRWDSSKGYTLDNVRPCCKNCNLAKNALSGEAFKAHIEKIYWHMTGRLAATTS